MIELEKALRALGVEPVRRGLELVARCPNPEHDDRNPSWRMHDEPRSEKHARHMCWSCGFKGEIVGLVALLSKKSRAEAEAWLDVGTAIVTPAAMRAEIQGVPYARTRFQLPSEVRLVPFDEWPYTPRSYVEARGITREQVARWGIGYAVAGRLAGRIVFAKRNMHGVLTGYSARTFVGDEKRYYEPRPEEGADMRVLYGEENWPASRKEVVVTEGAINALAWERAGAIAVAGLSGSEVTGFQMLRLQNFSRIWVATDSDKKGDMVAEKLMTALCRWAEVTRLRLPEGPDAAEVPGTELRRLFERRVSS